MRSQFRSLLVAAAVGSMAVVSAAESPTLQAVRITRFLKPPLRAQVTANPPVRRNNRIVVQVHTSSRDPGAARTEARVAALRQAIASLTNAERGDAAATRALSDQVAALATILESRLDALDARVRETNSDSVSGGDQGADFTLEVPEAALQAAILTYGTSPRTVVLHLTDTVDDKLQDDALIETAVTSRLLEQQFQVFTTPDAEREAVAAQHLAEWVTTVNCRTEFSQKTEGIISYTSHATIRLVNVRTHETAGALPVNSSRGLALGRAQAADRARRALADAIATALAGRLKAQPPTELTILVPQADPDTFRALEQTLTKDRGMTIVSRERRGSDTALRVRSTFGNAVLMALIQRHLPQLQLTPQFTVTEVRHP